MIKKRLMICAAVILFTVSGCGKNLDTEKTGKGPANITGAAETEEKGPANITGAAEAEGKGPEDTTGAAEAEGKGPEDITGATAAKDGAAETVQKSTAHTSYQVTMEQTEEGNRKISYPQLSGWELEEKQHQWNMYFKEQAEELMAGLGENDYAEAAYEITEQEEGILSLINRKYFEYESAAHPSAALDAVTIDMNTGERLTLKDFAEPSEVTDALLNTKDYQILEGVVELTLPDILEQNWIEADGSDTAELLTASFAHFDEEYENYGEGELMGKSYIKDGKLCLIVSVEHAAGDYAAIQLDHVNLK